MTAILQYHYAMLQFASQFSLNHLYVLTVYYRMICNIGCINFVPEFIAFSVLTLQPL